MHEAKEVAAKSVGENASPLPKLSIGASVTIELEDDTWTALVLNSPEYIIFEVAILIELFGKYMQQITCVIIFIFFQCISFDLRAQENYDITYEDAAMKFGLLASPNGIGLSYRNSIPLKNKYSWSLDFSFTGVKQIKEKQVLNQRMVNTTPYTYGKVNRLYALRPMIGISKELAEKQNKNSVGVNAFILLGPSIGFLKPNFVDIEYFDLSNPNVIVTESL